MGGRGGGYPERRQFPQKREGGYNAGGNCGEIQCCFQVFFTMKENILIGDIVKLEVKLENT